MFNKNVIAVATIAAVAIGFLISLQFQTQREVNKTELEQKERVALTQQVMTNLQTEKQELKDEYARVSAELEKYKKTGNENPYLAARLDLLKIADGTIAVKGQGVKMIVKDNTPGAIGFLTTGNLLEIINYLRLAKAEAISINGQRIVAATSVVRSGDSTILINRVPVSEIGGSGYEILAIGDQEVLVDYLTNFVSKDLKNFGMKVEITRENVTIPSYKGDYTFEYAKEVKTE